MTRSTRRGVLQTIGIGALAALATAGCQLVAPPVAPAAIADARSSRPRQAAPAVPPADLQAHVAATTAFAIDLYRQLPRDGNLFVSPYSIAQALMLVLAGARGQTVEQMTRVLRLSLPPERLHATAGALELDLLSRAAAADRDGEPGFTLQIANTAWSQPGYRFLPTYLDLLAEYYGAGLRLLDFRANPEGARTTINRAIADQTQGKITDLLPPASLQTDSRLVLTNAIYFKAPWATPFHPELTAERPFTLPGGERVVVPMMAGQIEGAYAAGEGFQAGELPFCGGVSLVVLVPAVGRFAEVERALGDGRLNALTAALPACKVQLTLPKLRVQAPSLALEAALTSLGMGDLFLPGTADLSGMDGTRDLFVSDGHHQATATIDEAGAEAAAATAVVIGNLSLSIEPSATLVVDRPFFIAIRDTRTGTILFLGRIVDPRG